MFDPKSNLILIQSPKLDVEAGVAICGKKLKNKEEKLTTERQNIQFGTIFLWFASDVSDSYDRCVSWGP